MRTVEVGLTIGNELDLDIYVINLSYNFIRSDRATFGVGVGVHLADVDLGITGRVNGAVVASGDADVLLSM